MKNRKIYTKNEALSILGKTAKLYHENLEGRDLLILSKNGKNIKTYEVAFLNTNFQHFTGTISSNLSASDFYDAALNGQLSISDFKFKNDDLTSMKIDILDKAVTFQNTAKMIGIYNGPRKELRADIGAGNVQYVMTFRFDESKGNDWLYPVGVQEEDVREVTTKSPIIAIFRKDNNDKIYDEITYKSKNISIDKLHFPKAIREKLSDEAYHALKPQQTEQLTPQKQVHQEKESQVSSQPDKPSSIAERIAQKQKIIQQRVPVKHTHPHRNTDQEL